MDKWNRLPGRTRDKLGEAPLMLQGFTDKYSDSLPRNLVDLALDYPGTDALYQLGMQEQQSYPSREWLKASDMARRERLLRQQWQQMKSLGIPFNTEDLIHQIRARGVPNRTIY